MNEINKTQGNNEIRVSGDTLIFALRYALKCRTGADIPVQNDIMKNVNILPNHDIQLIIDEIESAIRMKTVGDENSWTVFWEQLMKAVDIRNS